MTDLFANPDFWSAIVPLSWPFTILIVALLFRARLLGLLDRDQLTIKVAGMELSVQEATEQAGKGLSDLQERVSVLEKALSGGPQTETPLELPSLIPESRSILWVDDYPSNNAFIIERLQLEGVRIRKELSTDAGIAALNSDDFDLIISDLGRVEHGKDNPYAGLEFARALRAAGHAHPLLIFAGKRGLENRQRLEAAGVDHVTASPVEVFSFVEGVFSSEN